MNVGVFIPIGNNGWLLSENAPQYKPSFELNKQVVLKAEGYGLDFALSMIKLRGFGGKTEFWDHNLESFTLMAGLAAVTSRIKLFATAATLCMPPAIAARMAATIDSISNGRFGLNLVTGWQRPEYTRWACGPATSTSRDRYEYLAEYAQVLRDLWETGRLRPQGRVLPDGRLPPEPAPAGRHEDHLRRPEPRPAWRSRRSYADYNFCFGKGVNTPTAFAPTVERLRGRQGRRPGRDVVLLRAVHDHRRRDRRGRPGQLGALQGRRRPGGDRLARRPGRGRHQVRRRHQRAPDGRPDLGGEHQHGHARRLLRRGGARCSTRSPTVPGTEGVLLVFDDFLKGLDAFGTRIQPLMRAAPHIAGDAEPMAKVA